MQQLAVFAHARVSIPAKAEHLNIYVINLSMLSEFSVENLFENYFIKRVVWTDAEFLEYSHFMIVV